jgi:hypothetical protein
VAVKVEKSSYHVEVSYSHVLLFWILECLLCFPSFTHMVYKCLQPLLLATE